MQKLHTNTSASTGSGADGSTGPGLSRSTDSGIRDQNDVETPIDSSTGHYHCIALINVSLGGLNYTMGDVNYTDIGWDIRQNRLASTFDIVP